MFGRTKQQPTRPDSPLGATPLDTHNAIRRLNGRPAHTAAQMRQHDKTRDVIDRATSTKDPAERERLWDWVKANGVH